MQMKFQAVQVHQSLTFPLASYFWWLGRWTERMKKPSLIQKPENTPFKNNLNLFLHQHFNWPHRTNLFLTPLSSAENENRCDGQWAFLRQAGEENRSFLTTCWAPAPILILSFATPPCELGTVPTPTLLLLFRWWFTDELKWNSP